MEPKDLIQRSPLRNLDAALAGGLGKGNLGIVIARHGAGKTPFLVGIALDHLLRGERVLHVSLEQKVDHVREYYEQIFDGLAKDSKLDDLPTVHLEMERARRINTYLGNSFSVEKLRQAVDFMREHASFEPDLLLLDGYDARKAPADEVRAIADIAREVGCEMWMSAVRHRHEAVTDGEGIPEPVAHFKDLPKVVLDLHTIDGSVKVYLIKPKPAAGNGELPLVLDPVTMLVRVK